MEADLAALLEKIVSKLGTVQSSLATLSENSSKAELAEANSKADVAALQEQVAELESDEHQRAVVQEWARAMTPEAYLTLGQELGFDVSMATEEPAKVSEPAKAEIVYTDPHDTEYTAVPGLGCWVLPTKPVAVKV